MRAAERLKSAPVAQRPDWRWQKYWQKFVRLVRFVKKRKAPFPGPFTVAGAGFEPATSGLCAWGQFAFSLEVLLGGNTNFLPSASRCIHKRFQVEMPL